jgi:hypothetical protein
MPGGSQKGNRDMRITRRRRPLFPSVKLRHHTRAGALLALLSGALLAMSPGASAQSVTFTPGPAQEFNVPLGVATVEVIAVGGEGQSGLQCRNNEGSGAGAGGSGALVTATIPVSGVTSLLVDFGAGGAGGTGGPAECSLDGGAGGGSAEVLSAASAPLVVAGGGGGGGSSFGFGEAEEEESTNGGTGASASSGVDNGGNGAFRIRSFTREEGGGGEGGAPNSAGAPGGGESAVAAWSTAATTGTLATGGAGGSWNGVGGAPFIAAGGGGGAGHYGGGGGGTGNVDGGGGGAGASFIDETAGANGIAGSGAGRPQAVTLVYTLAAPPTAVISSPADGATYPQGAVVSTKFSCADGAGGSGIESCLDSAGGSGSSGLLATATPGPHSYSVTAKSRDGETATARIGYTVSAPVAAAPGQPARETPTMPGGSPRRAACVSGREITIHVANHVTLPAGTRIVRSDVRLAGRLVARVLGAKPVARVSLTGLPKGTYPVTLYVRTSTGKLVTVSAIFHTCTSGGRT